MYCTHCEKPISLNAYFCFHCGRAVTPTKSNRSNYHLKRFSRNNKWGYRDELTKEVVIQPIYDDASAFHNCRAYVKKGSRYGYIDNSGEAITPIKFDFVSRFQNNLAIVGINNKYTFINNAGLELTPPIYDKVTEFDSGISVVTRNRKYNLIDGNGQRLFPGWFVSVAKISDALYMGSVENDVVKTRHQTDQVIVNIVNGRYLFVSEIKPPTDDSFIEARINNKWTKLTNELDEIRTGDTSKTDHTEPPTTTDQSAGKQHNTNETTNNKGFTRPILIGATIIVILLGAVLVLHKKNDQGINTVRKPNNSNEMTNDWNDVINSNDLEVLNHFIDKNPNSNKIPEAKKIIETLEFKQLENSTSIHSFAEFVKKYPQSVHLGALGDQLINIANRRRSIDFYSAYLSFFPNGNHSAHARSRIVDLEWEKVRDINQVETYLEFIDRYPHDGRVESARVYIDVLLWNKAKELNTIQAFQNYISKSPLDVHKKEAEQRIAEIRVWNAFRERIESGRGVVLRSLQINWGIEYTGNFIVKKQNQSELEGNYSFISSLEERRIGSDRYSIKISCNIDGYSKILPQSGKTKDLEVLSMVCGPVRVRYDPDKRNFQITQYRWP